MHELATLCPSGRWGSYRKKERLKIRLYRCVDKASLFLKKNEKEKEKEKKKNYATELVLSILPIKRAAILALRVLF